MKFLLIFFLIALIGEPVLANPSPRPESARPYGMGNAFGAVANDFNAIFFNPAGLGTVKQVEISGNGGRFLPANRSPQSEFHLSGSFPLEAYRPSWSYGVLGYTLYRSGQSGSDTVTNFGTSWGSNPTFLLGERFPIVPIIDDFYFGLSFRGRQIKRTELDTDSTNFGVGVDLGFLYKLKEEGEPNLKNNWSFALAIQELNTKSIATPTLYRLGVAWRGTQSIFALDFVSQDGIAKFFPGMEINFFKKLLLLRLGSGEVPGEPRQIVLGIGTVLPPIQIDVAYGTPTGGYSRSNDRILVSLTYRFGTPLLAQYFSQEDPEKVSAAENEIVNLQSKRETLESAIREQKKAYESVLSDFKKLKEKTNQSQLELKQTEKNLDLKKSEFIRLQDEIKSLQPVKGELNKKIDEKEDKNRLVSGPRKHKVLRGDSLRSLAEKYYGDPDKWQIIYKANENKINRGSPREGEVLTIP